MGFCAACGQPGESAARFCWACGAPTAEGAGAGDRGRDRSPGDTAVLDAFGDVEPFGGIFREFRAARSGAWPGDRADDRAAGPEDPYDQLYAPRRDGPPGCVPPRPPPAVPAAQDREPAQQHGGAPRDPGPSQRHGEGRDSGPHQPHGEGSESGGFRQYEGAGRHSGPLRRHSGARPVPEPLQRHDGAGPVPEPLQYYGWMRRPSPAAGSRKRVVLAVLAVIALVAGGGGALGYGVYRNHPPPTTPAAQGGAGRSGPGSAARASSPPAELGNSTVTVTPAVAGVPAARPIISLLTSYFRAVNAHDYGAYRRLLDPGMQADMTAARFGTGYRSTVDSRATVTGISATRGGRVTADIVFTSHQAPSDSPDRTACTNWALRLFLTKADGGYLIAEPPPGYRPSYRPC